MSTPILNAPQSGILGMHKIQERPMAVAGKVEVLPMMYLALSYDHRIVDGREAVTFLVRVKESLEDLQGGTFTISNGGVYGSLMSTPILNAPQSGILGMHKIQDRPMVVGGQIVVRPMMYLALSYDHRLIDGKEAVQFLVTIKDLIEDPARILLEV
jgi:pyruvate/2-oxoglutarate dehydrogenase complex dihydrolipoamide acyltransferase (E2) component